METLAQRSRFARKRLKLSQAQVAQESGLNQSDVSKIERGLILKTTGLLGLSKALRVNIEWLDTGDGPMNIGPIQAVPGLSLLGLDLGLRLSEFDDMALQRRAHAMCGRVIDRIREGLPPDEPPIHKPAVRQQKSSA